MNNKKQLLLTIVVCLLPAAVGLILYGRLPEQMPIQWSLGGQVTSYAPKWYVVIGMPVFFFLFNIFCHRKANKNDFDYPKAMILFMKWVFPVISVIYTGASVIVSLL